MKSFRCIYVEKKKAGKKFHTLYPVEKAHLKIVQVEKKESNITLKERKKKNWIQEYDGLAQN